MELKRAIVIIVSELAMQILTAVFPKLKVAKF
jgi:hypothetical protein